MNGPRKCGPYILQDTIQPLKKIKKEKGNLSTCNNMGEP